MEILISHLLSVTVTVIFDAAIVEESITYWTHDGSLPVELRKSRNVSMDPGPVSSYLDACGEQKADLPDRRPSALQSMMKEGP